jgi:putative ABC transport system substrate-binding protein
VKKIAVLVNPNNQVVSEADTRGSQAAARRLGLEVIVLNGGTENEIVAAFEAAVQHDAGAIYVSSDAFFILRRDQIAALALRHSCPRSDHSAIPSKPVR